MKVCSALSCIIFFIIASAVGSSAELTKDQNSAVTVALEVDVKSAAPHDDVFIPDVLPRELKTKKAPKAKTTKVPKSGGKKPKSSKTLAMESPSSPPNEILVDPSSLPNMEPSQDPSGSPSSSQSSSQPSLLSQPSSQPTDEPCADIHNQKEALLALKGGFKSGDAKLTSWVDNPNPCDGSTSNWSGIACNSDGLVTEIDLEEKFLEGTISPLIGCPTTLVSSLTYLDLDDNNLTGTIPKELGQLTSLTYLSFYDNNLTGTIPMELGQLTSLTYLDLDYNQLTGNIPTHIGQLISLTGLDFGNNSLTGNIPMELGQLTSLTGLHFDNNNLGGTMPTEICKLRDNADPAGALGTLKADCNSEVSCSCCTNNCV